MAQNLDILLVTVPSRNKVFQSLGENLTGIEPPVWSTLLATFLRKKNISVKILDAEAESIGFDVAADKIKPS